MVLAGLLLLWKCSCNSGVWILLAFADSVDAYVYFEDLKRLAAGQATERAGPS